MSKYADRAMETSTTTGTGNIALAGAVTGYQTIYSGLQSELNRILDYTIEGVDASGVPTGEWEVGEGYLSASTTLVRHKPTSGSAATPVNFSAGTKRVFITYAAAEAVGKGNAIAFNIGMI